MRFLRFASSLGLLMLAGQLAAQSAPTSQAGALPVTVTVILTNLPSPTAPVRLNFYHSATTFLQPGQAAQHASAIPAQQRQLQVPVQLLPGEWAIALSQDLNNNGKMDRNWMGLPAEPYAFSNNVRPHLKAPSFDDCIVQVTKAGQVITIRFPD